MRGVFLEHGVKVRIPFIGFLVVAGVTGCAALGMTKFQEPSIDLDSIVVRSVGLTGGTLDLMLEVNNPNSFDLKGTHLELGLDVEGVHFGDVELNDAFNLPRGAPTRVVVPLSFNWIGVGAAARSALNFGTVKYEIEGIASLQTPFGLEKLPFKRNGSVALNQLQPARGSSPNR